MFIQDQICLELVRKLAQINDESQPSAWETSSVLGPIKALFRQYRIFLELAQKRTGFRHLYGSGQVCRQCRSSLDLHIFSKQISNELLRYHVKATRIRTLFVPFPNGSCMM